VQLAWKVYKNIHKVRQSLVDGKSIKETSIALKPHNTEKRKKKYSYSHSNSSY